MKSSIRSMLLTTAASCAILAGVGKAEAFEIQTNVNPVTGNLEITFFNGGLIGKELGYHFRAKYTAFWICADDHGKTLTGPEYQMNREDVVEEEVPHQASHEAETITLPLPGSGSLVRLAQLQQRSCPRYYMWRLARVHYDEIWAWTRYQSAEGEPMALR